jgi:hypothetical protein
MQQHRGSDAYRVTLHRSDEWPGSLGEIAEEPERLIFFCIGSVGLGIEVGNIVSGRETVAISLE